MKRIIVGVMGLVLVAAMVGAGTVAYFSDTATNNQNVFTTGTLTVGINSSGSDFSNKTVNSVWTSPTNWAPGGASFTKVVNIKNTGTVDAAVVGTDWQFASGELGLADYIQVTGLREWIPGYVNASTGDSWYDDLPNFTSIDTNGDHKISLKELITDYYLNEGDPPVGGVCPARSDDTRTPPVPMRTDQFGNCVKYVTDSTVGGGYAPDASEYAGPALPAGQVFKMEMTFQLMPETPNTYQGKSLTMNVSHVAAQSMDALP